MIPTSPIRNLCCLVVVEATPSSLHRTTTTATPLSPPSPHSPYCPPSTLAGRSSRGAVMHSAQQQPCSLALQGAQAMKSSLQSMLAQLTCGSWLAGEPHTWHGTAAGRGPPSAGRQETWGGGL